MVTATAFGARLDGCLGCVGMAMFSRRGPFGLRDGCEGSACWFVVMKASEATRLVRPMGAVTAGCKTTLLCTSAYVRSHACDVSPCGVRRSRVACRQHRSSGVLGSRMPPPLQPSRASVCMGGSCARERLSVTVAVRIVLGLRLTCALSCERCF